MLNNKNILITGASAGLGESLARVVAEAQGNLTLCARRGEKLLELKDSLLKRHPELKILTITADVGKKNDCKKVIEQSIAHFGQIDCVIANAGKSMWSRFADVADPDELDDLMRVNYMGVVYTAFYALPHLRASRGSYVAVSSILGAIPLLYHSGYVAAKYAVNGFIETVRLEEPDVHFLLAMPSWIAGTELRANAVSGIGESAIKVKKSHSNRTISAHDCAQLIINALVAKQSELYIPKSFRYVPAARQMLKNLVDRVVSAKVQGQLKK